MMDLCLGAGLVESVVCRDGCCAPTNDLMRESHKRSYSEDRIYPGN
jgi:hypothetical protein